MASVTIAAPRAVRVAGIRRHRLVLAGALVLLVAVVGVALGLGDTAPGFGEVLPTLFGAGDARAEFVLFRLRLPRVVIGILVGIGFGIAGGLFQTVLRNPLASPDILGISGGASAAAVSAMLLLGRGGAAVSVAALVGAAGVATMIGVLAWRSGLTGQRFVLVGVAAAMAVQGILGFLITRADVRDVSAALVWMVGSTASVRWREIATVAVAYAVLLPLVAVLSRPVRLLQLGDETGTGLGARPSRHRIAALALGVALVASGTAVVGPIAFVAFVSAPIARRLVGRGEPALALAGAVGAVIVTTADVIGQHALPWGGRVPVGIVTALVGAPYLLWLIAVTRRKEAA